MISICKRSLSYSNMCYIVYQKGVEMGENQTQIAIRNNSYEIVVPDVDED